MTMMPAMLNYARPATVKPKAPRLIGIIIAVVATATVVALWWGISTFLTERAYAREAKRLLAANAPAVQLPGLPPAMDAAGFMRLPDGRLARLYEANLPVTAGADIGTGIADVVQHVRANGWGYTIIGADSRNQPVVQVWVKSPVAYAGMCGFSTTAERHRGAMQVWRNPATFAAQQRGLPGYADSAYHAPVSIVDR